MTSSRKESSRDGQRELHYSDIWLTKSIRYQSTKKIQRTVPSFCTGKRKRTMIQYHELFSPANSSVTPRTFCTNFTYFYLLYPSVSLFWNAQDSHVIAYARIPCRFFHINPRTTPQFIGRSITGNGSFNELREGCLSRFGLSYFLYWCNQERCVLGLLMQTLRKLLKNRCP